MQDEDQVVEIFKAFCDKNRISILNILCTGEKCACKLLKHLDIGQPTLSHHMKILSNSGLVNVRKVGRWMHYSLNQDACLNASEILKQMTTVKEDKNNDEIS